jgi:hypothetical protein
MSFGEQCRACRKPLTDVSGPELMNREGHVYHLACWSKMMDGLIQETTKTGPPDSTKPA